MLLSPWCPAQNAFNNATQYVGSSDNTGNPTYQPGTEVLNSTPGQGVMFEQGGSFEHVGQFYVAANGIWNRSDSKGQPTIGTDYFGYAPGSTQAYLGRGIKGASPNNGGKGTGKPTFGHLQLNSTGEFPLEGGMYITHSLTFNGNGPGQRNVITTPNSNQADSPTNAVIFSPTATIQGATNENYINGFASVTGVIRSFTLPLGDPLDAPNNLRPLTINTATAGTVTSRYLHWAQHPTNALGTGIGSISSIGNWVISAPIGTNITVSLPDLGLGPREATTLRLVGWNGNQWVNLSGYPTVNACEKVGCPLTGIMSTNITDVAIGSTSRSVFNHGEGESLQLTIWPNPVQTRLQATLSDGQSISQLQALDLQGRPVTTPAKGSTSLDTSGLPSGSYVLEVLSSQGQVLRTHFIKQP